MQSAQQSRAFPPVTKQPGIFRQRYCLYKVTDESASLYPDLHTALACSCLTDYSFSNKNNTTCCRVMIKARESRWFGTQIRLLRQDYLNVCSNGHPLGFCWLKATRRAQWESRPHGRHIGKLIEIAGRLGRFQGAREILRMPELVFDSSFIIATCHYLQESSSAYVV